MPSRLFRSFALFALSSALAAQGAVHVVDQAGGAGSDFTSLAAAIVAAAPGDVLVVRSGDYAEPIALDAKPLVLVAEVGASVQAQCALVQNTAPGDAVLVRGLTLSTTDALSGTLSACQGPVWFEDTTFLGVFVPPGPNAASGGLHVESGAAVVLAHSALTPPFPFVSATFSTLSAVAGSRVHVFDSALESQQDAVSGPPAPAAISVSDSFLDLASSSAAGSDGAPGSGFPFCTATSGGNGLAVSGTGRALLRAAQLSGGLGGAPCGADGQALVVSGGGTTASVPGTVGSYQIDALVREDEMVHATFRSDPGDSVYLLYSTAPAVGLALQVYDGELVLGFPLDGFLVGTIPAAGELSLATPAPALADGQESLVLYTQAAVYTPGGRLRMATPSALVVIDDAF